MGGEIVLALDPTQSTLDMTMTVDVSIASDTDSDSSPLSGFVEIVLDDAGNPSAISITDLAVNIDQTMNFNWSFGFFGSADAAMSGGSVLYDTPGIPTGPVPVVESAFEFPELFVGLGGNLDVSYDIFLVGSDTQTLDLADQGAFSSPFSGEVVVEAGVITVTSTLPIDTVQPIVDSTGNTIGTVTVVGTAHIVASGSAPACAADLNSDGELNFFDVSAFLAAFSAQDPVADFNGDSAFNFFDVSAFLAAFSGGCP